MLIANHFFLQLALASFLQITAMGLQRIQRFGKYVLAILSSKGKRRLQILQSMENALTYEDWKNLAEKLDQLEGHDKWREVDKSKLFDCGILKKRIRDTLNMMDRDDVFDLMFRIRGGLARDQFGMQNEGLFSVATAGTKRIVEEYHKTVSQALDYICDHPDEKEVCWFPPTVSQHLPKCAISVVLQSFNVL